MPHYEFRCRACGDTFVEQRPMSASGDPGRCPHGHDDTVRLLSTVGLNRGSASPPAAGGCCGGACGCGH